MIVSRKSVPTARGGSDAVGTAAVVGVRIEVYCCTHCNTHYGLSEQFVQARMRDKEDFYCPWCQASNAFTGLSEEERLRNELNEERKRRQDALERAQATSDLLLHEERSHAATRGHLMRTRKQRDQEQRRAQAALCPVPDCGRHFVQMERHLKAKHPDYVGAPLSPPDDQG